MAEDRKRTYQSTTSLPKLRPSIGVPPLKMVLLGEEQESPEPQTRMPSMDNGGEGDAAKERVVRKIIAHLQKDS